ncbi:hypothetical protein STACADC2_0627 [Streptococcus thermophilus]|nr:hypothetical protein STACADC2_0627 [Streptococcus thermophilus]
MLHSLGYVARTKFDWKIYHLVEDDINEIFSQYKTHIGK